MAVTVSILCHLSLRPLSASGIVKETSLLGDSRNTSQRLRGQSLHDLRQAGFLYELETFSVLICDLKNHHDMMSCQIHLCFLKFETKIGNVT